MEKVFLDSRELDVLAQKRFGLSEDILMENAAATLEKEAALLCQLDKAKVLILAGSGNNGGDGWALARRLCRKCADLVVLECKEAKSPMCLLQKQRALACGVVVCKEFPQDFSFTLIFDCIFGAGFYGQLPQEIQKIVNSCNESDAIRIACDLPSGIDENGHCSDFSFSADLTVTMGTLKLSLFSDVAKDLCGKIKVCDLGVSRKLFEADDVKVAAFLLEKNDLRLPLREKQNVNKGSFGHTVLALGEKSGAAMIAASAAIRFGSGLVSLVNSQGCFPVNVPMELMTSNSIPANTSALAIGMGLGQQSKEIDFYFDYILSNKSIPCLLDADIFYSDKIKDLLKNRSKGLVLTPHPKEFSILLEKCGLGKYSVSDVLEKKIELVKEFCATFPDLVLLLKGANVLIARQKKESTSAEIFINPYGSSALAKGGSGDVLSGLTAALLAQGYEPLDAAKNASLAHALAGASFGNSYSMTPSDLIAAIGGKLAK